MLNRSNAFYKNIHILTLWETTGVAEVTSGPAALITGLIAVKGAEIFDGIWHIKGVFDVALEGWTNTELDRDEVNVELGTNVAVGRDDITGCDGRGTFV